MVVKKITAEANTGVGLWTGTCALFCNIFGCESKAMLKKQRKIVDRAKHRLNIKINAIKEPHEVKQFNIQFLAGLCVVASAVVVVQDNEQNDVSEGKASNN